MAFISEDKKAKLKVLLKKMDFLANMPEQEIEQIIDCLENSNYKKNQSILFQGEISNRLYLILHGRVSVWIKQKPEKKKITELGQGEYFGEISLLEPVTASATLKAEEDTETYAITREKFMAIADKFPGTLDSVKAKISERKEALKKKAEENKPQ